MTASMDTVRFSSPAAAQFIFYERSIFERLDPVALARDLHVVIAKPPFALATPAVFRAWDELGGPTSDRAIAPPPAVAHLVSELANDLEAAAERVNSQVRAFRERLEDLAGAPALLAGSGSAHWVVVPDAEAAGALAARLRRALDVEAFSGHALTHGLP